MAESNQKFQQLCNMAETLRVANTASTDRVASIRQLLRQIDEYIEAVLCGNVELTDQQLDNFRLAVQDATAGGEIEIVQNITTTATVQNFQLGGTADDVDLHFEENSTLPPERGTIKQKLWKIQFRDGSTGHAIISDASHTGFSTLVNAQMSTALLTAPPGSVEDLDVTLNLSDFETIITTNASRDLTSLFNSFEKPGVIARQLRDIDIDADPSLQHLDQPTRDQLKTAASNLNNATTPEAIAAAQLALEQAATAAGIWSTSLGPTANIDYSDLKRFKIQHEGTTVDVVASIPVISWGGPVHGIPLRDESGPHDRTNRRDDGTSYIVDLGGIDPVIRKSRPNPLPAWRYNNNGPNGATADEGAVDRYAGGKCTAINTTSEEVSFQTILRTADGPVTLTVPPLTAIWKIDRASFDLTDRHAYYTVFSASRAPASGYMGVVLAPKQNRLGRGRGEIASGVTAANGISKTGETFNLQDSNGPILQGGVEVDSGLKGVTCDFDGHAMAPADILKFLQDNGFTKGTQYLTIPANATLETVRDVLIPQGEFVPQITQALATLMQFANGKPVPDGGPARFQPGLIPFLPGTPAYTPEWHINWIFYNCGQVECDGQTYPVRDIAKDRDPSSWLKAERNPSLGPPGPSNTFDRESGFNPEHPDVFNPIQMRCGAIDAVCTDYIDELEGSENGEISLAMIPALETGNKIFITDSPSGALRGWVKFLVVNCPLPVVATINVTVTSDSGSAPVVPQPEPQCTICTCDREATQVDINGDLNPIWVDNGDNSLTTQRLKFKVGDQVKIRSTSGIMHGVSLRLDGMTTHTAFTTSKPLAELQSEILTELSEKIQINNSADLEPSLTALESDVIAFHGGIPVTFKQQATVNPAANPDGKVIADFTPLTGSEGSSGSVSCTVHGVSMSFRFDIC